MAAATFPNSLFVQATFAKREGDKDDIIVELSRLLGQHNHNISFLEKNDILGQTKIRGMLESPLHFEGRKRALLRFGCDLGKGAKYVGLTIPGCYNLFDDDKWAVDYIGIIDRNTLVLRTLGEHSLFHVCRTDDEYWQAAHDADCM